MTYCLGIKLKEGIVAISDTRITSGTETSVAEKYLIYEYNDQQFFIMTSGLRSVRDKVVTYFGEALNKKFQKLDKLYQAVNLFGENIRKVAREDKKSLQEAGLLFNLQTIIAGQLKSDEDHKMFLVYPEGNWVEIDNHSNYTIIGNSGFGKPVLKRTINYESPMRFALKTGFLSFDSTRVIANDVGYPIDVIIYKANEKQLTVHRFEQKELEPISKMWGELLVKSVNQVPDEWMNSFL